MMQTDSYKNVIMLLALLIGMVVFILIPTLPMIAFLSGFMGCWVLRYGLLLQTRKKAGIALNSTIDELEQTSGYDVPSGQRIIRSLVNLRELRDILDLQAYRYQSHMPDAVMRRPPEDWYK